MLAVSIAAHLAQSARGDSPLVTEPISVAGLLAFYEKQDSTTVADPPRAGESLPSATRGEGAFEISLSPALWMARVRGNTSLNGPSFTVDDEFGLNDYQATFNGELSASWGVFYKVMLTGWFFSTADNATAESGGAFGSVNISVADRLSNNFSAASAGAEFDVTLWQPFADQQTPWSPTIVKTRNVAIDGQYKADLRFKVIGAVRWYSASLSVDDQTNGSSDSWSMDAVMPGIGGGIELDFNTKGRIPIVQSIRLESSGGTGSNFLDGQYFTFIRAGLNVMFSPDCGIELGYRLEDFKLSQDNALFDGGVQGLFVGVNVKF